MGCKCSPSTYSMKESEIFFESNSILDEKMIQLKNNLTQSDNQEKNRFLDELKDNESYNVLDSIKLKDHITYECIQAYETYMNNKKRFEDTYNRYIKKERNQIKELNNSNDIIYNEDDNISNSFNITEEKLFKMPPIQHLDNTIYEGEFFFDKEKNQWKKGGEGILITSKNVLIMIKKQKKEFDYIEKGVIFYPNGDIFIGKLNKEEPYNKIEGIYFEYDIDAKYDNIIILLSVENEKSVIIKYFSNGSIYEGDAENKNNRYIFSGKGKLINKEKNIIYEGEFKGDLFNGEGKLFKPKEGIISGENGEKGIGKTIISKWVNGKPHGDALIREKLSELGDYRSTTCYFRFGKMIKSTKKLVNGKKILDENIYNFLTLKELTQLVGSLKTKSFFNFLKKKNKSNLTKIKIYNHLKFHEIGIYNKNLFNNELFTIEKQNDEELYTTLLEDKNYFLPFICYYSNGGEIEKRYRAYNIFNPNLKKIYSTNYLNNKNTNIIIKAIFNSSLNEEFKNQEEFFYDENQTYMENFINMANLYKFFYEKFERNYPVRKIDTDIIEYSEYVLNKEKLGNFDKYLCLFHYIIISVPEKCDDLSVLINPCYFFAVYINTYKNTNNNNYIDITDEEIKENNYDMNLIRDKYKNLVLKLEKEKKSFEYLEFDTMKQKEFDMKILCLVKIYEKNDLENPYLLKLKKFYHYGNAVNIKLINQYNIYNKGNEGFSIDFGTINFYGDIIYLKE